MRRKTVTVVLTFLFLGVFVSGNSAFADDIKKRMKERLPVVNELKAKGLVGEDNQGLLQFVSDKTERKDVVAAENNDRMIIYKAIAKQQNVSASLVGKRRAIQIARKARAGEWLQDAKGNWYQK